MPYTLDETVDGAFDDVVARTEAALADEEFGVLCDIDIQAAFAEKLDVEFRQYRILGACNPAFAKQALEEELRLGALLPCNVIVYETDGGNVGVSAVDPGKLLSVVDNPELDAVADDVRERFERVLDELAA
ncbi:DUF302 domain-containing protein [Halolamina sp.]|jgi:uncharacterized protein (DUF302 family)|uniref:DUF302 domain-containing protein n=1 Tax=Halolamina sp. TaxID=1940283 RepID=UPI000223C08C|nr:protein of unknown function DUF302 [halophilic archaeon DL31]